MISSEEEDNIGEVEYDDDDSDFDRRNSLISGNRASLPQG